MSTLPTIRSYGNYANSNYGAHTLEVSIGNLTLYFSYKTVVAFSIPGYLACSENQWSTTTGKHLNWIEPDKRKRLSGEEFEDALNQVLKQHKLV